MKILVAYCMVMISIINCNQSKQPEFGLRYKNISNIIEPGDIILRRGNSMISNMISIESPEKNGLTHVGIVSFHSSVIDIVGDSTNPFVRKDSLKNFIHNAVPDSICIMRLKANKSNRLKMAKEAELLLPEKIGFDYDFNSRDSKELYCSELVWFVIQKAYRNLKHPIIVNYRDKKIIGLQTFLNPEHFKGVYSEQDCR